MSSLPVKQENSFMIAAIFSRTDIIMNAGHDWNVRMDQIYNIVDSNGQPIVDPQTGKILFRAAAYKFRLRVVSVEDHFSQLRVLPESGRDELFAQRMSSFSQGAVLNVANPNEILSEQARFTHAPVSVGDQVVLVQG